MSRWTVASMFQGPPGLLPALGLCAVAAILVLAGVFRVWTRMEGVRLGYQVEQNRQHLARLSAERGHLAAEVAALESPIRIAGIAQERLGLSPPVPEQVVMMEPEPVIRLPGFRVARR